MNGLSAYCPQCRNVVNFIKVAGRSKCPLCGFEYQLADPLLRPPSPGLNAIGVFGVVLRVFIILVVLGVIGLAIAFVGCAIALKNI